MKKILVFFTGGTIGSKQSGDTIDVESSTAHIIGLYESYSDKEHVNFTVKQKINLLSENIVPKDWEYIIHELKVAIQENQYDGVIITHGTDTLPYSVAAVSFLFHDTTIPMVFIASNEPVVDHHSDGFINFNAAVDLIVNDPIPRVLFIFQNTRGNIHVFLGTRIQQSLTFQHSFDSFELLIWGEMCNRRLRMYHKPLPGQEEQIHDVQILKPLPKKLDIQPRFDDRILYIQPYPGLSYDMLSFGSKKPKAIIHDMYHSSTSSIRESYSVIDFIKRCQHEGIDVFLTSFEDRAASYTTTHEILKSGAIPVYNMLKETSIVKLMLAYGNGLSAKEVIRFMNEQTIYIEHLHK
ncbi:asparaginase [Desulfuribacillus stibiiarsenatis]|nr:asparaginase domain-containing protein [Desulfuribacillus stibiiarsenatis]